MAVITFAHRGGAADHPENTVEAFVAARRRGASGLESDARLADDGVPVLVHDPVVRKGLRRTKVRSTSSAALAELGVPTLDALYDAVGADLEISLDLKDADAAAPTLAVAARHDALARLWLCSPDLDLLRELRDRSPDVRLVHSTRRTDLKESLERHAAVLADAGIDACNFHRTDWSTGLVVLFHRFEVRAFAWDVQQPRHFRDVLSYGVDAVYSDHVDRMVAMVAEWEETVPPPAGRA